MNMKNKARVSWRTDVFFWQAATLTLGQIGFIIKRTVYLRQTLFKMRRTQNITITIYYH